MTVWTRGPSDCSASSAPGQILIRHAPVRLEHEVDRPVVLVGLARRGGQRAHQGDQGGRGHDPPPPRQLDAQGREVHQSAPRDRSTERRVAITSTRFARIEPCA